MNAKSVSLLLLLPVLVLLGAALALTDGHLIYTLDDPYIHLALARHLWAGHYGINPLDASAPSSSILWPFLLAPFAAFESFPFIINIVCLWSSAFLLLRLFAPLGRWTSALFVLLLLFSLNFYGLVFSGMEHNLQLLLVLFILRGLVAPAGRNRAFYLSLFLLPLVRYEGLAITAPIALYAFWRGERARASLALFGSLAVITLFSLFLHARGLGFLPSSVLAKSAHGSISGTISNGIENLKKYGFLLVVVGAILIATWRKDRLLGLAVLAMTALHFAFGRYGWYGRYEVYYVLFILVLGFHLLLREQRRWWPLAFALPFTFNSLINATVTVPRATSNVLNQQGRMADLARELGEPVAVNDLGLVALRGNVYVLDLFGLGSIEALRHRVAGEPGEAWIPPMMEAKQVRYALVYDEVFPRPPKNWIKVGELRLLEPIVTPPFAVVSLYATSPPAAEKFRRVARDYASAHPSPAYEMRLAP